MPVQDWGEFVGIVLNTLHGRFFWSDLMERSYLGMHFAPGSVLLACPFVCLFQSPKAFFLFNSLVLALPAPMLFLLGLRLGLGSWRSLSLAVLYLLSPVPGNVNTAIIYGFHEVYLAAPFIVAYFLLLESGRSKAAFAVFLLSLTLKETVAVFWIFMGVVHILQGRRTRGAAMGAISLVYFLLAVKVLIPHMNQEGSYAYMNAYKGLGSSMTQILASPFTDPGAFFGRLLRRENIYMLLSLALPAGALLMRMPLTAFSSFGILAFVCLKDSLLLSSINSWYLTESSIAILIACAYAMAAPEGGFAKLWRKAFFCRAGGSAKAVDAALCGALASSALAFLLLNVLSPLAKNDWSQGSSMARQDFLVSRLKADIPEGAEATATPRLAAQLLFRNRVFLCNAPPAEWVALDLEDSLSDFESWETFRRRLILSGKYSCVSLRLEGVHPVAVFKRGGDLALQQDSSVRAFDAAAWADAKPYPISDPSFEVRYKSRKDPYGGQLKVLLLVHPLKKLNHDVNFFAEYRYDSPMPGESFPLTVVPFGNGVRPAYLSGPQELFTMELPIPGRSGSLVLKVRHKPAPSIEKPPF